MGSTPSNNAPREPVAASDLACLDQTASTSTAGASMQGDDTEAAPTTSTSTSRQKVSRREVTARLRRLHDAKGRRRARLRLAIRLVESGAAREGGAERLLTLISAEATMASLAASWFADALSSKRSLPAPEVVDTRVATELARFVGEWRNVRTTGLEAYLKHLGVSWAKRKLALAFSPQPTCTLDGGALTIRMPSPIGCRVEVFTLGVELEDEDPSGKRLLKTTTWRPDASDECHGTLITVVRDPSGKTADFVTERHVVRSASGGAQMVQTTTHDGVSFQRVFEFVDPSTTEPVAVV